MWRSVYKSNLRLLRKLPTHHRSKFVFEALRNETRLGDLTLEQGKMLCEYYSFMCWFSSTYKIKYPMRDP